MFEPGVEEYMKKVAREFWDRDVVDTKDLGAYAMQQVHGSIAGGTAAPPEKMYTLDEARDAEFFVLEWFPFASSVPPRLGEMIDSYAVAGDISAWKAEQLVIYEELMAERYGQEFMDL